VDICNQPRTFKFKLFWDL